MQNNFNNSEATALHSTTHTLLQHGAKIIAGIQILDRKPAINYYLTKTPAVSTKDCKINEKASSAYRCIFSGYLK
jgi:hypothetical protein